MTKTANSLVWVVKNFNCNCQLIEDYNVLAYKEGEIKKLKKKCASRVEFAEALKREMQWQYWSRAECELIIEITEDNRVVLKPWVGCYNPEQVAVDVTDDESFDWRGFAEEHIGKQIYKNEAKVDVFDQLCYKDQFEKLVTYLWSNRLKYERDNPKYHEEA